MRIWKEKYEQQKARFENKFEDDENGWIIIFADHDVKLRFVQRFWRLSLLE